MRQPLQKANTQIHKHLGKILILSYSHYDNPPPKIKINNFIIIHYFVVLNTSPIGLFLCFINKIAI